ncbi:hypothetical protein M1349_02045 [Patescibacteria group bacterium]|nr:hypothetical protein [Patescibacteria group bacterium]
MGAQQELRRSVEEAKQLVAVKEFGEEERVALIKAGAVIYTLKKETIQDQIDLGRPFWHIANGGIGLLESQPKLTQVAVFPDYKNFYIPNSGEKTLEEQEKLAKQDAEKLRLELGINGITEIIPSEASALTQLVFMHLDKTGEWLFGHFFGRTNNSMQDKMSTAIVGNVYPEAGLHVNDWPKNGKDKNILAVRFIVPA